MIDPFDSLLHEVGKLLGLSLHLDRHQMCAIQLHGDLVIQLQTDSARETLLLISKVAPLPPGRFRAEVFKEALKANALPDPRVGILAFLPHSAHLILFQNYPFALLNAERLAGLLGPFIDTAESWRSAIASGSTCPAPAAWRRPF